METNPKLLVVDDDEMNRELLARRLTHQPTPRSSRPQRRQLDLLLVHLVQLQEFIGAD